MLLLVLALLLAQTLGFVHRIVHASGHGAAAPGVMAVQGEGYRADIPSVIAAPKAAGLLDALFRHGEGDPTCRIFDQSSGGDALAGVPAVVLPMAVSSFVLLYFQGEVLARWVALFDARGPPSIR